MELDELPGWIGSLVVEDDGERKIDDSDLIGTAKLELGSSITLRERQPYACYLVEFVVLMVKTKRIREEVNRRKGERETG